MTRLIDADALTDTFKRALKHRELYADWELYSTIDNAPTIDAEPVVRCKDCKHYIPSKEMLHKGWCDDALQNVFKEDFYCGFGKRRETCTYI